MTLEFDWAGVRFMPLFHHDARMLRAPGLFGFVRRGAGEATLLFIGHAESLAETAGPRHPQWAEAMRLGMDEIHVCLHARRRIDRLQLCDRIAKRVQPILNAVEDAYPEPIVWASASAPRRLG